ncbi:class I SAM-dependent methyltransferase, partial [Shewanella sp. 202IG2-18]|uniref:class I SAM-dependent methyltransferase n=1 Tax=Parashewanella hymeniacidonis TaxID=2807618 RepID=UPI00195FE46F
MVEDNQLFVPTLNQQGYATVTIDPFSKKFTEYADGTFLEIGAAFGYTTLKALENGATVIANDMDDRHLKALSETAKEKGLSKLQTITAQFPIGLDFDAKSFRKILICRVLHFFSGEDMKQALKKAHNWLEVGGELYVVCETTFLTNWQKFIPEYENRKRAGEPFPGEINNPKFWEN